MQFVCASSISYTFSSDLGLIFISCFCASFYNYISAFLNFPLRTFPGFWKLSKLCIFWKLHLFCSIFLNCSLLVSLVFKICIQDLQSPLFEKLFSGGQLGSSGCVSVAPMLLVTYAAVSGPRLRQYELTRRPGRASCHYATSAE